MSIYVDQQFTRVRELLNNEWLKRHYCLPLCLFGENVNDTDIEHLLQSLSLDLISGYRYVRRLVGGLSTTALLYSNETEEMVLKLLILPRSTEELAAFKDEAKATVIPGHPATPLKQGG